MSSQSLAAMLLCLGLAWAEPLGSLEMEVLRADNEQPLSGVKILVRPSQGQAASREITTDSLGKARLEQLPPGDYVVEMSHPELGGESALVKVEEEGTARLRTRLQTDSEPTFTVKERREVDPFDPTLGSVTKRDREFLDRQIADRSLQGVAATAPGLQTNSLGQIHARGEHKSLAFFLDGVPIPVPMASATTQPIDPDFLSSLQLRTGGLNGMQNGQTGLVLDAETLVPDRPFFDYQTRMGSQATWENLVRAGGATDNGDFSVFLGAKTFRTDRQFEAPHPDLQTLHNQGIGRSYLLRMAGKTEVDQFGATFAVTENNYQLPQTPSNYDAGVRQSQQDSSVLGLLSWQRKVDSDTDLNMSVSYLRSRQRVRHNDIFTNWTPFDEELSEELAEEGLPEDPTNPGSPYLPTSNLLIQQVQPRLEWVRRLGSRHEIRMGANADFIYSRQNVDLIDAGGGGGLPDGAPSFQADISRSGFYGGLFFSHTLPLSDSVTLNYGLRADQFNNGLNVRTSQISPLFNLAYAVDERNALRFSYNRSFQAPPLELDVSGQTQVLPQRVTALELSYESQLADHLVGKLALVRKDYRDQVDIGLLVPNSNIPLFAPINFPQARYEGLELSLNSRNPLGWNGFLAGTLSRARPLEASPFSEELPLFNDHDQRLQVSAGLSYKWENGLSAAVDCLYGSGYPQEALGLYNAAGITPFGLSAERVPRFITNLSFNYFPPKRTEGNGPDFGGGISVLNLFDQRPLLNFLSEFSGTRFVPQRRILFNGQIRF